MVQGRHPCDHVTYSTIITALYEAHNTQKAIEIFKEMQEIVGITPSIECFTSTIDSFCKERYIDEALAVFQDMVNQDVQPDISVSRIMQVWSCGRS